MHRGVNKAKPVFMEPKTSITVDRDIISILRNAPIFTKADDFVLEKIASVLIEQKVKRGQAIFKKGDEGKEMFIIKDGLIRVHDGNHVLSRLKKGQVFGEFALFDEESRSASVTAEEVTELLVLKQVDFYEVLSENVDVTKGVLKNVIRRIREMNELESKLAKSYLKIQKQKNEIEEQHQNILEQKNNLIVANEQLTRLNEDKNQLISIVSHGLRNPLTSSLCVMDLLNSDKDSLSEDQLEYVEIIQKGLRRMNSMINQTLDIDVIELQRSHLNSELVNLKDTLHQLKDSFKYTLSIKKLMLDLKTSELNIMADKNFIYVILDNILSNAIKFSPANETITMELFEKNGRACIEISDEGPGMTSEAIKTLFDKPQLHHRQTDKTGLSIVKKYVEAMDGELSCRSNPGNGTTFVVCFNMIKSK
jgi:signal transduction histidine kinase